MSSELTQQENAAVEYEQYGECRRLSAKLCELLSDLGNKNDGFISPQERSIMRELSHGLVVLAKGLEGPLEREKAKRRMQRGSAWHESRKILKQSENRSRGRARKHGFPWEQDELTQLSDLYLSNKLLTIEIAETLGRSELAVVQKLVEFELVSDHALRLFSYKKREYRDQDTARVKG